MIDGPPRRWIAPSTPPPPTSAAFAALTIASAAERADVAGGQREDPVADPELVHREALRPVGRYWVTITSWGGFAAASRLLK